MTALPPDVAGDLRQENARLRAELGAARDRQSASAEILRTIGSVAGDADQSLHQIAETTKRLFEASSVSIFVAEGDKWGQIIHGGASSKRIGAEVTPAQLRIGSHSLPGAVFAENRQIHLPDIDHVDPAIADWPGLAPARAAGTRTLSGTPLRLAGQAIGVLTVHRDRLAPFSVEEFALLQSFADQAAIAIENARLFNKTRQALDRQNASAEILRAIAATPGDAERPLQLIAETTARLFGCQSVRIRIAENGEWVRSIAVGASAERISAEVSATQARLGGKNLPSAVVLENRQIHIPDLDNLDPSMADWPGLPHARAAGTRTMAGTPLRREGAAIGVLNVYRDRLAPFGAEELALLQSFADQAVIAIENARLFNESQEALERQTATADILKVIASSPSDVQPVFEAIAASANRLIGGFSAAVFRFLDGSVHLAAFTPVSPAADAALKADFPSPVDKFEAFRLAQQGKPFPIPDTEETPHRPIQEIARLHGFRSMLFVPLMNGGVVIGIITLTRLNPGPFSSNHVQLLQTFADQAVIAIENVRLFNETKEALERQTATADILKVIASSPSDVQPVFEAIAASANRLVGGFSSTVFRFIDGVAHLKAFTPTSPEADDVLQATFPRPMADFPPFQMAHDGEVTQIPDTEALSDDILNISRARGFRSMLFTPLMSDGESIGFIAVTRVQPGSFADHHVQLLQTFADQAVIAIENVRLFDEVQAKTRDLTEALQQQTATADVLKVISRSVFDLQIVLDTLVESACELCGTSLGLLYLRGDEAFECKAIAGEGVAEASLLFKGRPIRAGRGTAAERVILTGEVHSVTDFFADPDLDPKVKELIRSAAPDSGLAELRSTLAVPMTRDGVVIGVMVIARSQTGPFPVRQIELLQTFADQAVIAIENARLFDEVQARTRELTESLQFQTATSDVLKVISRSAFDLQSVFDTLTKSATELGEADYGMIFLRKGDVFHAHATSGVGAEFLEFLKANPRHLDDKSMVPRVARAGSVVHIPDRLLEPEFAFAGAAQALGDLPRTMLGVPLLRNGAVQGVFVVARHEPKPFSRRQIELVEGFSDQAVIALENVRLFEQVQARTRELAASLDELRTAQDRLVQTEKLASLGQLTAGIAHEIKNPLNFVNNFAALSAELTDELNEVLALAPLDDKTREEVGEITHTLKNNLQKVVQHGKRADSIVKNMLLHSREGSGEHRPADINALLDESLNLAYHGARAEKPQFNVTLERDFDEMAGTIEVFPQEITRVFLNLISNGFYAVSKRKNENGGSGFEPIVSATTKNLGDTVEVRIRDNGIGIPPEVKEKMFNPFFTTKPAGEGTGLGLSMSHDIIVKQHGGTIDVVTKPGEFTEFTILLPRTGNVSRKSRG